MQISIGRHAHTPGATWTHAHAVQSSQRVQEHPFAIKEAAEAEMATVLEEVAADDAAMSEIRTVVAIKIASNPVVTVEPAASAATRTEPQSPRSV